MKMLFHFGVTELLFFCILLKYSVVPVPVSLVSENSSGEKTGQAQAQWSGLVRLDYFRNEFGP